MSHVLLPPGLITEKENWIVNHYLLFSEQLRLFGVHENMYDAEAIRYPTILGLWLGRELVTHPNDFMAVTYAKTPAQNEVCEECIHNGDDLSALVWKIVPAGVYPWPWRVVWQIQKRKLMMTSLQMGPC